MRDTAHHEKTVTVFSNTTYFYITPAIRYVDEGAVETAARAGFIYQRTSRYQSIAGFIQSQLHF